jgi:protocatechuate 3,4-dioxygenase beta subunit
MVSSTRQALACIFALVSVALAAHAQTIPVKEPGATITGNVTVKGKAAAGVIVVMRQNDRRLSSNGREYSGPKDVTDAEGNYRIVNVPPGSYRIMPASRVYVPTDEASRERTLLVARGDTIEHVDFALAPGGVITGKVVDAEGRPMVDEMVQVFTVIDNKNVYGYTSSSTDDRGVYRVYGLRAGSYRVAAGRGEESFHSGVLRPYRRTYYPSVSDPLQATVIEVSEGGETKDIDITFTRRVSTYSVSGRIVNVETGQPLANVDYGITRYDERNTSTMSGGYVTNARGEFKLTGLAPGKYSLPVSQAPDSDLRFEESQFEVVDHDVTNVVIKATRGGSISGVVVFEGLEEKTAREQLGRAWIMAAIDTNPAPSRSTSTQIRPDGSFTIRGLGAGTASLHVHANGSLRVERIERDGVVQSGGIAIREREQITGIRVIAQVGNATIRGKIDVTNGTLPADARFSIWTRRVDGEPMVYSSMNQTQVDPRGQFVIEGLIPGTYELNAGVLILSTKVGYLAKKEQVVVTSGSSTTINITIDLNSTPIKQ